MPDTHEKIGIVMQIRGRWMKWVKNRIQRVKFLGRSNRGMVSEYVVRLLTRRGEQQSFLVYTTRSYNAGKDSRSWIFSFFVLFVVWWVYDTS